MSFSLTERLRSIGYALSGVAHLIRNEHNAWIHLLATVVVIFLGCFYAVTSSDWMFLIIAITLVWMAEGMNTAIERLADAVSQDQHPLIGQAKDVAAGAVLLAAFGAVIIACLVLYPYVVG